MMKDRPKTQITFEAAKHGFEVGEHHIGAPQLCFRPLALVAAQAIDTGEINIRALNSLLLPSNAEGSFAAGIGLLVDLIMLTDAVLFFFQTAYAFPHFSRAFFGAGALQP